MTRLGSTRSARPSDAGAITGLEAEAFGADAWSAEQVADELAATSRRVVVAENDGHVLGYAAISVAGDTADLTRIVVAGTARRAGIATLLLAELHETAQQAGAERVLLEVAAANTGAVAFYRAHGYAEIARRRGYYPSGDDALVLERHLDEILGA
jgi:ribosomal-protein-alanine acetyltransferase